MKFNPNLAKVSLSYWLDNRKSCDLQFIQGVHGSHSSLEHAVAVSHVKHQILNMYDHQILAIFIFVILNKSIHAVQK